MIVHLNLKYNYKQFFKYIFLYDRQVGLVVIDTFMLELQYYRFY